MPGMANTTWHISAWLLKANLNRKKPGNLLQNAPDANHTAKKQGPPKRPLPLPPGGPVAAALR